MIKVIYYMKMMKDIEELDPSRDYPMPCVMKHLPTEHTKGAKIWKQYGEICARVKSC